MIENPPGLGPLLPPVPPTVGSNGEIRRRRRVLTSSICSRPQSFIRPCMRRTVPCDCASFDGVSLSDHSARIVPPGRISSGAPSSSRSSTSSRYKSGLSNALQSIRSRTSFGLFFALVASRSSCPSRADASRPIPFSPVSRRPEGLVVCFRLWEVAGSNHADFTVRKSIPCPLSITSTAPASFSRGGTRRTSTRLASAS